MLKKFEIMPTDNRKSFYHKCYVEYDNALGTYTLYSYQTAVARFDAPKKTFSRLWDGWSATTARHINAFCEYCNVPRISKNEWEHMAVES